MSTQKPAMLQCPTCKKQHAYDTANPYRPFCSERCRLVDFGRWAKEEYRVPAQRQDDNDTPDDA